MFVIHGSLKCEDSVRFYCLSSVSAALGVSLFMKYFYSFCWDLVALRCKILYYCYADADIFIAHFQALIKTVVNEYD